MIKLSDIDECTRSTYNMTAADAVKDQEHDPEDLATLENTFLCVKVLNNGYTVTGQYFAVDPIDTEAELKACVHTAEVDAYNKAAVLLGFAQYLDDFDDRQDSEQLDRYDDNGEPTEDFKMFMKILTGNDYDRKD